MSVPGLPSSMPVALPYSAGAPVLFGTGSVNSTVQASGSFSPRGHTLPRTTALPSLTSTVSFMRYQTFGCQEKPMLLSTRGRVGTTRTRTSAVSLPCFATTRPNWAGGAPSFLIVTVADDPFSADSLACKGGGGVGLGASFGGGGSPSGGRSPASDQATSASP